MQNLWRTHHALQVLSETAVVDLPTSNVRLGTGMSRRELATRYPNEYMYLAGPISVGEKRYHPLVRESLSLSCELSILFLRQDEAGRLITQGGDIDGRIKCLLDALRMPSADEQSRSLPEENELWCLMQGDELITRLDVDTDRLLFSSSTHHHEVHLVIEVSINVLRVGQHNIALV
jgi:hypothetical protein